MSQNFPKRQDSAIKAAIKPDAADGLSAIEKMSPGKGEHMQQGRFSREISKI